MCQKENNPTIEKTTAETHQRVFNASGGVLQLAPKQICILSDNGRHVLNSELYTRNKNLKSYKTNKDHRLLTCDRHTHESGLNMFFEIYTLPLYL